MPAFEPIPIRFWRYVRKGEGCWEWTASLRTGGYGQFTIRHGKPVPAHRMSYELAYGPIPDGMLVCHHCDNRLCVRPDHLFLGTYQDNNEDMRRKGRHGGQFDQRDMRGEAHPRAKLTWADVTEIRAAVGVSQRELARRYGVSRRAITFILNGHNWNAPGNVPKRRSA